MATRGAKVKPASLRLVTGTRRTHRHGTEIELRKTAESAVDCFGTLKRPARLGAKARKAWDSYIAPAYWLDASREPAAIAFCELWQEFLLNPTGFPAAKHGQMRAYMSELGLTDERNRTKEPPEVKDEFFDD